LITVQRFVAQIDQQPDGCWLWVGTVRPDGYGLFGAGNRRAHRVAYELFVGPIPEGAELDHLCRVRHCVKPAHLEPVTPTENRRRQAPWHWRHNSSHCPNGHPYSGPNLIRNSRGRTCRECTRRRSREWARRKKAAG
jgi:hypothetical protein